MIALGNSGTIVRSTDNGTTFDNATSPTANRLSGIGFGNNIFVAVGEYASPFGTIGQIVRSTDNGSSFDNLTSAYAPLLGVTYSE